MKLISIVIPAYNEEDTISIVLQEVLKETKREKNYKFEIIVVDNNSKDATASIVKKFPVTLIVEKKRGKGCALIAGFKKTKGKYIIMMDSDGSHEAKDIKRFLQLLDKNEDCGMVIGSRILGGSDEYNTVRATGNILLTGSANLLLSMNLTDALNGYKAFRRNIFDSYTYTSKEFEIEIELIQNCIRLGYAVKEIPSHERARQGGKMKSFALNHGTKFMVRIIKSGMIYRFNRKENRAYHKKKIMP